MLCLLAAPWARAQNVPASLLRCAGEKDDVRRLACYDDEVARLGTASRLEASGATASAAAPPAAASTAGTAPAAGPSAGGSAVTGAAAAAQLTDEEKFGLRGDQRREEVPEKKQLTAVVTEVHSRPYGEQVVTLDNGQVWTELAASSGLRVKAGDKVRIEEGALKSFVLIPPNGRSAKVKRIK